jgi:hypothetical protein
MYRTGPGVYLVETRTYYCRNIQCLKFDLLTVVVIKIPVYLNMAPCNFMYEYICTSVMEGVASHVLCFEDGGSRLLRTAGITWKPLLRSHRTVHITLLRRSKCLCSIPLHIISQLNRIISISQELMCPIQFQSHLVFLDLPDEMS